MSNDDIDPIVQEVVARLDLNTFEAYVMMHITDHEHNATCAYPNLVKNLVKRGMLERMEYDDNYVPLGHKAFKATPIGIEVSQLLNMQRKHDFTANVTRWSPPPKN